MSKICLNCQYFVDNICLGRNDPTNYCCHEFKEKLVKNNLDTVKTMIQHSLHAMYKQTGSEEYKQLYEQWYENYAKIRIVGLGE